MAEKHQRDFFGEWGKRELTESQQAKEEGMRVAAENRSDALDLARAVAAKLGRTQRFVSADDVARAYEAQYGVPMAVELGPAAGSIFKGRHWVFTGRRVQSTRLKNHARELKVWEFQG